MDIQDILSRLDIIIGDGPAPTYFNNPAKSLDIRAFEERQGVRLPESYKAFLSYTNGGMIMSNKLKGMLETENGLEDAKWNANYLYSLEEMEKEYEEMSSWNFGIPSQNMATYPFIPFCHTATGERLVFVNSSKGEKESPVLDAYHEETPETWGVVAENFIEFLFDYVQTFGDPKVLGDLENGNALDLIEPMMEEEIADREDDGPETLEKAIARASRNLKKNPDDHWQMMLRGMAYKDLKEYKKALDDYNRGIELDPEDAYYHFNRGDLYLSLSKYRAALIDFDIAVKFEPEDVLYLDCRATALIELGKYDAALKDVSKSISIDKNDTLAYMVRERIYRIIGETEKAEADARKINELQGKD